ncbi:thioesterase family protein [Leifsonia naganoensis]|uniref:Acyl-CoA thioesterase n=1 Tax=Leifsonia naganoensis TaxID=150025 RepID=A0A853DW85_9MICO|nr:thioesterase family protein [Leifsonia naganoensis]NYK10500.1 acyl-CoA thioesterase [Leifsonia naganoensis]
MATTAYFLQTGEHTYTPTSEAGGAWADDEIHFSPLGGLIAHEILRHAGERSGTPLQLGRISYDILGFLALEPVEVHVETIRPGRTIELVEATAVIRGRAAVKARAWLLSAFDTSEVAGGAPEGLPAPESATSWPMTDVWRGGYVASLDARAIRPPEPGRATVWLSTTRELIAGVPVEPVASWLALVDTANGVAVRRHPTEWMFPNVDLTVHLHREPAGGWLGLDTGVVFGSTGLGVTRSVLHDRDGAVGFAEQSLTIRRL